MKNIYIKLLLLLIISFLLTYCTPPPQESHFKSSWNENVVSNWIGADYWSNRLQDWQINKGRLECLNGNTPKRTVHLLTRELNENQAGDFSMQVRIGKISADNELAANDWTGFLIGAGSISTDYRKRALIHQTYTNDGGLIAAISGDGRLHFFRNDVENEEIKIIKIEEFETPQFSANGFVLQLNLYSNDTTYKAKLSVKNDDGDEIIYSEIEITEPEFLSGNIALIANGGADNNGASFWYKNWELFGTKVTTHPNRMFGPVAGILYTIDNNQLRISAQMMPVGKTQKQSLKLDVALKGTNQWQNIADKLIDIQSYTVAFDIPEWDTEHDFDIRLVYNMIDNNGVLSDYTFYGSIPKQTEKCSTVKIAVMHGNSNTINPILNNGFDFDVQMLFPHSNLIQSIAQRQIDMLVFTGNQIDEFSPTIPDTRSLEIAKLDYLYKWYLWQWSFGELTKKLPTIIITDAHDYFQNKLWGEEGKKAPIQPQDSFPSRYLDKKYFWSTDQGGYIMPPEFVKLVEKTQVQHLPLPYDSLTIKNNLTSYYTDLTYRGISFAILEGRKFKTSPQSAIPEQLPVNGYPFYSETKPEFFEKPFAKLLGTKQMEFLDKWACQWDNNTYMKVVISQSDFADIATYPDSLHSQYTYPQFVPFEKEPKNPSNEVLSKDMFQNAWPQEKRNLILKKMRSCFAFSISGGSNLGRITQHGVSKPRDAVFNFTPPPLVNKIPVRWYPSALSKNWNNNMYNRDGFNNFVNVDRLAYFTTTDSNNVSPPPQGYGIVTIDVCSGSIIVDCISATKNTMEGFPFQFNKANNFPFDDKHFLPNLRISGLNKTALLQIFDVRTGECVYTIRLNSNTFRPQVPYKGKFKVIVSSPDSNSQIIENEVNSVGENDTSVLEFRF